MKPLMTFWHDVIGTERQQPQRGPQRVRLVEKPLKCLTLPSNYLLTSHGYPVCYSEYSYDRLGRRYRLGRY
jgi:hypothetical protein